MNEKYGLIIGKEYISNNYGTYTIIDFIYHNNYKSNKTYALIRFNRTGYECEVPLILARNGIVRDKYALRTTPIDLFTLPEEERETQLKYIIKPVWKSMIQRCYNNNAINYNRYGTKGILVCNEWMNFDIFFSDLQYLFQYDKWYRFPTLYNLDKDYIAYKNNIPIEKRYYSKNTCVFLHYMDNTNLRSIEYREANKHNTLTSKYFGVDSRIINGDIMYRPRLYIDNKEKYFGWFKDEQIAAAVYNYHYLNYHKINPRFELIPLLNDVPYISPEDFIKYNQKPKQLVNIIK